MVQNTPKREHISLIFAGSHFNEEMKALDGRLCLSLGVVVQPAPLMKQISIVSVRRQAMCQGTLCQERQVWDLDSGAGSQKFILYTVYWRYKPSLDCFPKISRCLQCPQESFSGKATKHQLCAAVPSVTGCGACREHNTSHVRQRPASLGGVCVRRASVS